MYINIKSRASCISMLYIRFAFDWSKPWLSLGLKKSDRQVKNEKQVNVKLTEHFDNKPSFKLTVNQVFFFARGGAVNQVNVKLLCQLVPVHSGEILSICLLLCQNACYWPFTLVKMLVPVYWPFNLLTIYIMYGEVHFAVYWWRSSFCCVLKALTMLVPV